MRHAKNVASSVTMGRSSDDCIGPNLIQMHASGRMRGCQALKRPILHGFKALHLVWSSRGLLEEECISSFPKAIENPHIDRKMPKNQKVRMKFIFLK